MGIYKGRLVTSVDREIRLFTGVSWDEAQAGPPSTGVLPGRGTRVGYGWVCAAQASKCRLRFIKDLQPK